MSGARNIAGLSATGREVCQKNAVASDYKPEHRCSAPPPERSFRCYWIRSWISPKRRLH